MRPECGIVAHKRIASALVVLFFAILTYLVRLKSLFKQLTTRRSVFVGGVVISYLYLRFVQLFFEMFLPVPINFSCVFRDFLVNMLTQFIQCETYNVYMYLNSSGLRLKIQTVVVFSCVCLGKTTSIELAKFIYYRGFSWYQMNKPCDQYGC